MATPRTFPIGARVRLTGNFLRWTGQYTGAEPFARWLIVPCACGLCASGRFVAVNEASADDPTRSRHIHAGNLELA